MISLIETPLNGEPDAGNPPVRFGGRGEVLTLVPSSIRAISQQMACPWPWTNDVLRLRFIIGAFTAHLFMPTTISLSKSKDAKDGAAKRTAITPGEVIGELEKHLLVDGFKLVFD